LTNEFLEVRVRYCDHCEAELVDGCCEYCGVSDADGVRGYPEQRFCLDSESDQTVLCTEYTSTETALGGQLYESSQDDFSSNGYALDRRDGCIDWLSKDDMVS